MYIKTSDEKFKDYKYFDQDNDICITKCSKYLLFNGGISKYNCLPKC